MKRFGWLFLIAAGGLWFGLTSCHQAPPPPPTAAAAGLPTNAQPRLRTMQLWVGPKQMTAELALTPIQEETGMMFRTNIGANDGMLFVLDFPQRASFWMTNCFIPLSAAYIDPDGVILEIHELKEHDANSVVAAANNVKYVLEAPKDWFTSNSIPVGTTIGTEKGPINKVFP